MQLTWSRLYLVGCASSSLTRRTQRALCACATDNFLRVIQLENIVLGLNVNVSSFVNAFYVSKINHM